MRNGPKGTYVAGQRRIAVSDYAQVTPKLLNDLWTLRKEEGYDAAYAPRLISAISRVHLGDYESQIERAMERGSTNRTVASTNMNATSSRAHTVTSTS